METENRESRINVAAKIQSCQNSEEFQSFRARCNEYEFPENYQIDYEREP